MAARCLLESHDNCIENVPIFSNLSPDERQEIAGITK
jgi:hypothetical protein